MPKEWDVFISHATEDKDDFVRPLAQSLAQLDVKVWYDEFTLRIGDSLSRSIDKGLAGSRYGIVVISPSFIQKQWPERELRGLVAREIEEEQKVILPIWLGVTKQDVLNFSPPLADSIAIRTEGMTAEEVAISLLKTIRPDIYKDHPRAELEKMLTGQALQDLQEELEYVRDELAEYQCPFCKAPLIERTEVPAEPENQFGGGTVEHFECGFWNMDGKPYSLCPHDPLYPKLEEYEIVIRPTKDERFPCRAFLEPGTENAKRLRFDSELGHTEEEARNRIIERFNFRKRVR